MIINKIKLIHFICNKLWDTYTGNNGVAPNRMPCFLFHTPIIFRNCMCLSPRELKVNEYGKK